MTQDNAPELHSDDYKLNYRYLDAVAAATLAAFDCLRAEWDGLVRSAERAGRVLDRECRVIASFEVQGGDREDERWCEAKDTAWDAAFARARVLLERETAASEAHHVASTHKFAPGKTENRAYNRRRGERFGGGR